MLPNNYSNNMNKQLVKYNWFSKQNHEVFVQCKLKEPHIECQMTIPFPQHETPIYENELIILSVCTMILLFVILCTIKRK